MRGDTHAFDEAVLLALRTPGDPSDPVGPHWVEELGRDATALGGTGILTFVTLAVAGFLWLNGSRRSMGFLLAAIGTGTLLSRGFKALVDRPRPDLVPHGSYVYTASFPSGHSLMAALVWLTLAVMLAREQPSRTVKVYLVCLAALVAGAVGVSRVYLGVHWPSDVAAGWALGTAWALVCWAAAAWLGSRGNIEPERGTDAPDPSPSAPCSPR